MNAQGVPHVGIRRHLGEHDDNAHDARTAGHAAGHAAVLPLRADEPHLNGPTVLVMKHDMYQVMIHVSPAPTPDAPLHAQHRTPRHARDITTTGQSKTRTDVWTITARANSAGISASGHLLANI